MNDIPNKKLQGESNKSDFEQKPIRAVIPTKDNPPPELSEWLEQFQVRKCIRVMFSL